MWCLGREFDRDEVCTRLLPDLLPFSPHPWPLTSAFDTHPTTPLPIPCTLSPSIPCPITYEGLHGVSRNDIAGYDVDSLIDGEYRLFPLLPVILQFYQWRVGTFPFTLLSFWNVKTSSLDTHFGINNGPSIVCYPWTTCWQDQSLFVLSISKARYSDIKMGAGTSPLTWSPVCLRTSGRNEMPCKLF